MIGKYLDLSTDHLTQDEVDSLPTLNDVSAAPRVIPHEYGAWVHVSRDDDDLDETTEALAEDFPNLLAVIRYARGLDDVFWINFDADGEVLDDLPDTAADRYGDADAVREVGVAVAADGPAAAERTKYGDPDCACSDLVWCPVHDEGNHVQTDPRPTTEGPAMTTRPDPTTAAGALTTAICVLNTWLHPDATAPEDQDTVYVDADAAIATLARIRDAFAPPIPPAVPQEGGGPPRQYTVTWAVEEEARSHREAARTAVRAILNGDLAWVFHVTDGTTAHTIDLSPGAGLDDEDLSTDLLPGQTGDPAEDTCREAVCDDWRPQDQQSDTDRCWRCAAVVAAGTDVCGRCGATLTVTYQVWVGDRIVHEFEVPDADAVSTGTADRVSVSLRRKPDGANLAAIVLDGHDTASVGHWPDGEEWVEEFTATAAGQT